LTANWFIETRETVHRLTHSPAVFDIIYETVDGTGKSFVSELPPKVAPKLVINRGASWDHNSHKVMQPRRELSAAVGTRYTHLPRLGRASVLSL
jgi:hypothetical protein